MLAKADIQFSHAVHTQHKLSADKLMACVSKANLVYVSAKKFSHEDLSAITKIIIHSKYFPVSDWLKPHG